MTEQQDSTRGKVVSINSMEMYYELHGEGNPLVLLHNFTSSGQIWEPFIGEFSKHFRLIVPDLRGHGRSTNPTGTFTHRQAALDVFALLDHLGIREFRGIGSSSGGMILIHMATQQPDRVEAMVLASATIYFPEQARENQRQADPDAMSQERWKKLRRIHKHGDDQIRALIEQFRAFADIYNDMNFTPPYLSTITARTLIVHGDRDKHFPVSIPVQMYKSIPRSYLWIIPNKGHGSRTWDDALYAFFTKTVLEFLQGTWEQPNLSKGT
jgi:pimeloyl-ACP methyl ester carboxylesterase